MNVDLSLREHKTDLIYKKVCRDKTLKGKACEELTSHIDDVFTKNIADDAFMSKVDMVLRDLKSLLVSHGFKHDLMMTGSVVNGLCSKVHSDLDLTVMCDYSYDHRMILRKVGEITKLKK